MRYGTLKSHSVRNTVHFGKASLLIAIVSLICNFRCLSTDVLTYHNDNARTGWNSNEVVLTPGNVNESTFGLKHNLPVDGKVDAQPLYVSNATVFSVGSQQGSHNLVIVATEHDSLYAFDADSAALCWKTSLLLPGETPSDDRGCDQVTPEIGVTATPVIDRNKGINGIIYVVAMSKLGTVYYQRLHAIDLATGQEVSGSPVAIQARYPGNGPNNDGNGHVVFDPAAYKERSALLLLNGIVYTTWASHCDNPPYTSWIIGYDEASLAQVRVLNLDHNGVATSSFLPDGSGNAFWNSGAGPAADANGNIYDLTANGPFETALNNGFPSGGDYGDTFLKLSTLGSLVVSDYFTPFDQAAAAANDLDLGSGGALVLPDMVDNNGATRHLAIGAGKDQNIYLVDRDNMGKFNPGSNNIYQELQGALPNGEFATAAYFNGAVYYGPVGGALRRFTLSEARLDPVPAAMTSTLFAYPGVTPSISSSGNSAGIVWAYENPGTGSNQAVLHAYDATFLTELYNSNQNASRDQFGTGNKFITPTVCDGKVFVGTTNSVGVFGLLVSPSSGPSPTPGPSPAPGSIPPDFLSYSGDFNADGKQDILWRNMQTGEVRIWYMNGSTILSNDGIATVGLEWQIVGIGDFDGDGFSDILWENAVDGSFSIWTMHGDSFVAHQFPSPGPQWSITSVADINHNGVADILWRNIVTGEVRVWLSVSPFNFASESLGSAGLDWNLVGTADLFGDGLPELIWQNQNTGETRAWQLRGVAIIANVSLGFAATEWKIVGLGDFIGAGRQDILWRNTVDGSVDAWIMNGFTIAAQWHPGASSLDWRVRATPDVNGNHVSSILWSNLTSGEQEFWTSNGSTFVPAAPFAVAPPTWIVQPEVE
jgi:FG-GAP-like repeat